MKKNYIFLLKNHPSSRDPEGYLIYLGTDTENVDTPTRRTYAVPIGHKTRYTLQEALKEAVEISDATGLEFRD